MKRYEPTLKTEYGAYDSSYDYAGMCESDDGDYVLYEDVQSIQAERDRLREALSNVDRINDSALYSHDEKRSAIGDIARKALEGGTT